MGLSTPGDIMRGLDAILINGGIVRAPVRHGHTHYRHSNHVRAPAYADCCDGIFIVGGVTVRMPCALSRSSVLPIKKS